jgi:choline dehydrogenase
MVLTEAEVETLTFSDHRCSGVRVRRHGAVREVTAQAEVILAAGAIGSPVLLQRSGIGPGVLLQALGIPLRCELAGVGQNLQDHLQLRLVFKVRNAATLNERAHSLLGKAAMALEYALYRTGPLSMAPSQLGAFARSGPDVATADLEYHVQPLSLDRFGEPLHSFPAITTSVCHLRPQSRGQVRARSASARDKPVIQPNYLSVEADRQVAVAAIRLTRRIMAARAMAPHAPEEHRPGAALQTDVELERAAGDLGTTIFHPVGTCKMGPDHDTGAVVDPRLRVRRISGLRVVDASIMPTITSGNTNAPVIMIAEKAAQMIGEDARGG